MRILIIKLGAKGDVVRTLSLLPAIRRRFPNSEITWVTKPGISELLSKQKGIDKVLAIPCEPEGQFDVAYNLDIEREATELLEKANAKEKYGFSRSGDYPSAINAGAEYYLETIFDDELKKNNKKTYQEMMFGLAEIPCTKERYSIDLDEESKAFANSFLKEKGLLGKKIIGVHMGSGPRWPSKAWSESRIKEFVSGVVEKGFEVILFGGPDEKERHERFVSDLDSDDLRIFPANGLSDLEFAALISHCSYVVCSDSFALHISLGMGKKTIGLFFCTSPDEVEGYGILKKVVSPMLYDFFPERMDVYDEGLTSSISAREVLEALDI